MADNIEQLTIGLAFDNEQLKDSAKKIEQTIGDFSYGIKNKLKDALSIFSTGFGLDFAKDLATNFASAGAKMQYLSQTLNTNVSTLSIWGEAVKRVGGNADQFYSSIHNVQDKIQEMTTVGNPELGKMLSFLHINPTQNGHAKDSITLLNEFGDALQRLQGPRARAYQQQFARQFGIDDATLRLLLKSKDARQQLLDVIRRQGVMTDEETRRSIELNNKLADVNQKWERMKFLIGQQLGPTLADVSNEFLQLANNDLPLVITKMGKLQDIMGLSNKDVVEIGVGFAGLVGFTGAIKVMATVFGGLATGILGALSGITQMVFVMHELDVIMDKLAQNPKLQMFTIKQKGEKTGGTIVENQFIPNSSNNISESSSLSNIYKAQLQKESGGNPNAIGDHGKSFGLWQIQPGTAAEVLGYTPSGQWLLNPDNNNRVHQLLMNKYLAQTQGNVAAALARYNGGNGGLNHYLRTGKSYNGYSEDIMKHANMMSQMPKSANLQSSSGSSNTTNKTTSINVHNLNLPHITNSQDFVASIDQGNVTSWAYSGSQLA